MATIKGKELLRAPIIQRMHDAAPQIFAGPRSAKAFALDAQERDLIEWIDHPQLCIEFQTIDDADRVTEPNMFGAKVAVPVDNMSRTHTLLQQACSCGQKAALDCIQMPNSPGRQIKSRIK